MLVDFGKANLLGKITQQPDKVKQVLEKFRTDGIMSTLDAVRSKLDQPLALGYSNAGVVIHSGVDGLSVGDRVVSNGYHAEVVRVPRNLCAKIPKLVDDESASFTVLAAIGLQGIRLAQPSIGEVFVVQGLGLIGLLVTQMLRANGCRVLGIDFDSARCDLARQFGATTVDLSKGEDPISVAGIFSGGRGVDGVVICASTKSDAVVRQATEMCRKRGRIVLVGVVGLNLRRDDFYKKEISFQVSASYGPGRYDPAYEQHGHDYPIGFVRWTQQRNFEAVLDMMAMGTLNVKPLITHRTEISNAAKAYELLGDACALGIVINYPNIHSFLNHGTLSDPKHRTVTMYAARVNPLSGGIVDRDSVPSVAQSCDGPVHSKSGATDQQFAPVVGFIGAGNHASRTLIPAFKHENAQLDTIASLAGISSVHHGRKAGFAVATTDVNTIWSSPRINTVVIATRHGEHASQVIAALHSGKHVFVEKPLCLKIDELDQIRKALRYQGRNEVDDASMQSPSESSLQAGVAFESMVDPVVRSGGVLMVGFNRRFSPHIQRIKKLLDSVTTPKCFIMTVNAGEIAADHWTQDIHSGGGRIIGEACHFIDLLRFLAAAPIADFDRSFMASATRDTVAINLKFSDGSIGSIHYISTGSKSFPKERLEVFTAGRVLVLDNFRKLTGYGWPGFSKMHLWRQDKGQLSCVKAFLDSIRRGKNSSPPIPLDEILEVSEISIKLAS